MFSLPGKQPGPAEGLAKDEGGNRVVEDDKYLGPIAEVRMGACTIHPVFFSLPLFFSF
jgi:hypothetical protein